MNKKLALNIVAAVGFVALVVGLFLNVWQQVGSFTFAGETISEAEGCGLFTELGLDIAWLGTITEVLMIVAAVVALAYVVLFVLDACKVVSLPKVQKLLAIVLLAVTLAVVVCGVLFSILGTSEFVGLMGEFMPEGASLTFGPAIGFYLVGAGALVAGVAGLLASNNK